jgi:hypothetical protein
VTRERALEARIEEAEKDALVRGEQASFQRYQLNNCKTIVVYNLGDRAVHAFAKTGERRVRPSRGISGGERTETMRGRQRRRHRPID